MATKKVLMLHGFAQSAQIFSAKTGGLRKALLKAGYETIYIDAPLSLSAEDAHNKSDDAELYGWWPYGAPDYDTADAMALIKKTVEDQDVEGIIGFSQGAGLGGFITTQFEQIMPSLKFAVFFSGFRLMPERFNELYERKIQLPTLHVIGELDTVVEEGRSLKLWDAVEESRRTMLKHHGGHFVPNSKDFVNKVINWIINAATEGEKKKPEIEDDDMFAAIDNMGKA